MLRNCHKIGQENNKNSQKKLSEIAQNAWLILGYFGLVWTGLDFGSGWSDFGAESLSQKLDQYSVNSGYLVLSSSGEYGHPNSTTFLKRFSLFLQNNGQMIKIKVQQIGYFGHIGASRKSRMTSDDFRFLI